MRKIACLFGLFLLIVACTGRKTGENLQGGDTLPMKYAENLCIVKYRHFTLVELKNPWKAHRLLHRYILLHQGDSAYRGALPKGTLISRTVHRAVVFTTAHAALLQMLGVQNRIAGVCDLKYMFLPELKRRVNKGNLIDCGDAMAPDVEKIVSLQADALLLSPFENSGGYGTLEKTGIPIIECADYMETSPLGRAEWMKFYGLLFGCEDQADSLFKVVEARYLYFKSRASKTRYAPSVLTERKTGSTWYVPGGRSTVGRMLRDAHAAYPFADDHHSGSLSLPFESVLEKGGEADFWMIKYNSTTPFTYADLLAEYHGYAALKAFKNKQVFGCNASVVRFFEETPFRPDLLLRDYLLILHPEERTFLGNLRYFSPLQR